MGELLRIRGRPTKASAMALLQSQGLPVSDITDEHLEHFFFSGFDKLTTSAEKFFTRLGYGRIDRSQAPPCIQRTPEFASLCPASSAFMFKRLQSPG